MVITNISDSNTTVWKELKKKKKRMWKITLCTPWGHIRVVRIGVYSFQTSALDRGECSAWWLGHLPSGKRDSVGPWIRSGRCREEIQLLPLPAYEPQIVQPVTYTLYFLRYLGIILHNFWLQSAKPSASFYPVIHLNSYVSIQCHYFNHQPQLSQSHDIKTHMPAHSHNACQWCCVTKLLCSCYVCFYIIHGLRMIVTWSLL